MELKTSTRGMTRRKARAWRTTTWNSKRIIRKRNLRKNLIWSVPLRQRDPVHFPLRTCPYNLLLTEGEKSVSRIWNHLKICFLGLKKKTGKIVSNPGSVLVGFLFWLESVPSRTRRESVWFQTPWHSPDLSPFHHFNEMSVTTCYFCFVLFCLD